MINYQYQILRYVHDRVTGEFVNIGIIALDSNEKLVVGKFLNKYARISHFFKDINGQFLLSAFKEMEKTIYNINKDNILLDKSDIANIGRYLLPNTDDSLQFSEKKYAIDLSLEAGLLNLYDAVVDKYTENQAESINTDQTAWRKVYKRYFDEFKITSKLRRKAIQTSNDAIEFERTWKNGDLHCYQTLSFNLKTPDAIKNKVYKWSGILNALETSEEKVFIHLLTTEPKEHLELKGFIESSLSGFNSDNVKVDIIHEDDARNFAFQLSRKINQS
jgi:hypothetical protein